MPNNMEENEFGIETTYLPPIDACMTLDTIQEAKEGSSLSGESSENLEALRASVSVEFFISFLSWGAALVYRFSLLLLRHSVHALPFKVDLLRFWIQTYVCIFSFFFLI